MIRVLYILLCILATNHYSYAQVTILNDDAYIAPDDNTFYDDNNYKFQILKKVDKNDLRIPDCGENNLNFAVCEPGVCKSTSVMGDTYFKITIVNNFCHYEERSTTMTGLNCNLDMKSLAEITPIFSKRILNTTGLKNTLTKEELDRLDYVYEHNCTSIPNPNYTKVITLDDRDNGFSDIPSDIVDTANLTELLKYDPRSSFVRSSESVGGYGSDIDGYRSIMFTSSEIDLIYVLQEIIRNNQRQGQAFDASSVFNSNALGKFYLSSLLFRNDASWVVWMNNIKMTDTLQSKSLAIEKVTQDKVKFKWISTNLDKLSPNWKTKMVGIDPEKYISREFDITVAIKGDKSEVTFGLKPNQTFDATTMRISEGKK